MASASLLLLLAGAVAVLAALPLSVSKAQLSAQPTAPLDLRLCFAPWLLLHSLELLRSARGSATGCWRPLAGRRACRSRCWGSACRASRCSRVPRTWSWCCSRATVPQGRLLTPSLPRPLRARNPRGGRPAVGQAAQDRGASRLAAKRSHDLYYARPHGRAARRPGRLERRRALRSV